ncbi:MAG TPA: glycosyltransferase 87 family protein, partial [Patescibacteria group bacterium]
MATNRKVSFLLLFILCTFLVFYRLFSLWNSFLPDFHVFYFSAIDLLQSRNPYADTLLFTQLNYPIISLMPFLLLTFFPFYFASKIYIILNILALMGILFLSLKIVKQFSIRSFLAFLVLSLFFFPVSFTLGMGQVNLIAYFLLLLGIYLQ